MTFTFRQILRIADSGALGWLAAQPLPVTTGFRVMRIRRLLMPVILEVQETRNRLITTANAVPVRGGGMQVKPECMPAFESALDDLDGVPITVEIDIPLAAADLAGAAISADHIDALGPLIVE